MRARSVFPWAQTGRCLAVCAAVVLAPALQASSTSASLALDASSTSVGVASGAISGSSRSVSPGKAQAAEGQHRVMAVHAQVDPQGRATVQLEAQQADERWNLHLPQRVVAQQGLQPGDVLTVQNRAWGFAVARAASAEPFYLVLHDDWADTLAARPASETTNLRR